MTQSQRFLHVCHPETPTSRLSGAIHIYCRYIQIIPCHCVGLGSGLLITEYYCDVCAKTCTSNMEP